MPCGTKLYSNKNATLTPDNLDYESYTIYNRNMKVSICTLWVAPPKTFYYWCRLEPKRIADLHTF